MGFEWRFRTVRRVFLVTEDDFLEGSDVAAPHLPHLPKIPLLKSPDCRFRMTDS